MKMMTLCKWVFGLLLIAPSALPAQTEPGTVPPGAPGSTSPLPGSTASQATPGINHVSGTTLAGDSSVNGGAGVDVQTMKDKIFLRKAAQGGLAEVQFGQLAAQKAASDDVKKFGERLAADHTMLNETLKPIASSLGLNSPAKLSKPDQAELDKLTALSGPDFDKEYLTFVTVGHRKDLKDFSDEEASANDPVLKDAVARGERILARHMHIVERLDAANGVAVTTAQK